MKERLVNCKRAIIAHDQSVEVAAVLCGVAESSTSKAILNELFSERFWASTHDGAGGIRTVSAAQGGKWGYQAKALPPGSDPNWNYGLLGGVWPNLAMWAARAAASQGWPEHSLKALRATYLLNERENPAHYNVVPGEFNGYCNGDDLIHKEMPLRSFLPGIFFWASMESFMGITPHATGISVNPTFPKRWKWAAISAMPYRGTRSPCWGFGRSEHLTPPFRWRAPGSRSMFQRRCKPGSHFILPRRLSGWWFLRELATRLSPRRPWPQPPNSLNAKRGAPW